MKKLIKQQFKALGITQESFCEDHGHKYKDFADKVSRMHKRIDLINKFIEPLGLELKIGLKNDDK